MEQLNLPSINAKILIVINYRKSGSWIGDVVHNLELIQMDNLLNHPYPMGNCYFCGHILSYLKDIGFYGKDTLGKCSYADCEISNCYHIVNEDTGQLKQISFSMGGYFFSYGRESALILSLKEMDSFKIKVTGFPFVTHKNFTKIEKRIEGMKIFQ